MNGRFAVVGVVAYWTVLELVRRYWTLPEWMSVTGPFVAVSSNRFGNVFDRLASRRLRWRFLANVGVALAFLAMTVVVLSLVLLATGVHLAPETVDRATFASALVTAGIEDVRQAPHSVALGFLVALTVHEFGHAVLCRVEGIGIASSGVWLFGPMPVGGFVEINAENRRNSSYPARLRVLGIGVATNLVVGVVSLTSLWTIGGESLSTSSGEAVVTALAWVGGVNLALGLFNCLPSLPLDGGHLLRTGTEALAARMPRRYGGKIATGVSMGVWLLFMVSLAAVLVRALVR